MGTLHVYTFCYRFVIVFFFFLLFIVIICLLLVFLFFFFFRLFSSLVYLFYYYCYFLHHRPPPPPLPPPPCRALYVCLKVGGRGRVEREEWGGRKKKKKRRIDLILDGWERYLYIVCIYVYIQLKPLKTKLRAHCNERKSVDLWHYTVFLSAPVSRKGSSCSLSVFRALSSRQLSRLVFMHDFVSFFLQSLSLSLPHPNRGLNPSHLSRRFSSALSQASYT